jgi:hypothetical protein
VHPEQDVLEKFEFFPVKCRIQRASDEFANVKKRQEDDKQAVFCRTLKTKVNLALGVF